MSVLVNQGVGLANAEIKESKLSANVFLAAVLTVLFSGAAMAWTAPATTAAGYGIYDLVVNDGVKGPLGFVGGIVLVCMAGMTIKENVWKAVGTAVGGAGLIKAETLATSFGALI